MTPVPDAEVLLLRQSVSAMGTTFSIALHGRDRDRLEAAVQAAFDEVRRLDRLLSIYRPDSEWSLVNRLAAHQSVELSPESFDLIAYCLEQSRLTDGAFDVTVGALKRAWGFLRGHGRVPEEGELADARALVGHRLVHLDAARRTIRVDRPGIQVDPGGVGKGYAVDRIVGILRRHGFDSALVAGSQSSLYGVGVPAAGAEGWRADICTPDRPGTSIAAVTLRDAALSTSGTGEQSFWEDSAMYSHIVDPRTGWPLQAAAQTAKRSPRSPPGPAPEALIEARRAQPAWW